jgi:hypothetical protein
MSAAGCQDDQRLVGEVAERCSWSLRYRRGAESARVCWPGAAWTASLSRLFRYRLALSDRTEH